MKNAVISVAVLLIVLVGAFLMLSKPEKMASSTSSSSPSPEALAPSPSPIPVFSMDEVAKHAVKDDCWLVIDGGVYDVTKFVPVHPGEEEILRGCGIDATALFATKGGRGITHSQKALDTRESFKIGILGSSN